MIIYLCPKGHRHTKQWRADHCPDCQREAGRPVLPRQTELALSALAGELKGTPWERKAAS